jgi:hypothetical protein
MLGTTRRDQVVGVVAGLVLVGASFLPWARTGRAERSGFGLARAARAAGIAEGRPLRALITALFIVPVLVAAAWLAAASNRPRLVGGLVGAAGLVGIAAAAAVIASPVVLLAGTPLGLAGAVAAVALGARLLAGRRSTDG